MTTTGEQVGAAVDNAVDAEKRAAQDAIDQAKRDADAAAAEAKRIADAAMSTELGSRIETQAREFDTWRTAADLRHAEMVERQNRSEAQLGEATTLLGSIRALLTPAPPPPPKDQTPPGRDTDRTGGNSTGTGANGSKEPVKAETPAPPAPRKRHFL